MPDHDRFKDICEQSLQFHGGIEDKVEANDRKERKQQNDHRECKPNVFLPSSIKRKDSIELDLLFDFAEQQLLKMNFDLSPVDQ
jgi:hypothetical protein